MEVPSPRWRAVAGGRGKSGRDGGALPGSSPHAFVLELGIDGGVGDRV